MFKCRQFAKLVVPDVTSVKETDFAVSPDGNVAAISSYARNTVHFASLATGKPVYPTLDVAHPLWSYVVAPRSVCFTQQGKAVLVAASGRICEIMLPGSFVRFIGEQVIPRFEGITSLDANAKFVLGCTLYSGKVFVFCNVTGDFVSSFKAGTKSSFREPSNLKARLSPDGCFIATVAYFDYRVESVWSFKVAMPESITFLHSGEIVIGAQQDSTSWRAMIYSPDGTRMRKCFSIPFPNSADVCNSKICCVGNVLFALTKNQIELFWWLVPCVYFSPLVLK